MDVRGRWQLDELVADAFVSRRNLAGDPQGHRKGWVGYDEHRHHRPVLGVPVSMRRLLTALIASLLVCGVLPVPALAAQPVTGSAQAVSTSEDTPLTIVLSASDDDAGDAVTAFSFPDGPTSGSLGGVTAIECAGDQPVTCTATVDYTPDPNFNGVDSFSYTATDSNAETSAAQTIDVTVSGVN